MGSALTATAVERAKPSTVEKNGKREIVRREIADGGCPGLYLVVQPSGAKSWALRFRSPNRTMRDKTKKVERAAKKLTLGTVAMGLSRAAPQIGHPLTLSQARMLATAALETVRQGVDPTAVRREEKAKIVEEQKAATEDVTVDARMMEFLKRYKGKQKQGLRESTRLLTATYFGLKPDAEAPSGWKTTGRGVLGSWTGKPLASITKRDAITLLDGLVDAGHGVTANRTLTVLKTFFTWCIKNDHLDTSPVAVLDAFAAESERERVLTKAELVAAWKAAEAEAYPFGRLVQLAILTGSRRDELRKAPRSEFELDGASLTLPSGGSWRGPLWTLPAARAKNGNRHLVPLSSRAVDVLRALPSIEGKGLLFTLTGTTPISGMSKVKKRLDAAMLAELRKTDPDAVLLPWTLHDLRRTFYTGLQQLGFPIEVADACVNHKGNIRGAAKHYAWYEYLAEKTVAFDAWARHVDALVKGSAVVK
ncbi:site-specific integrase [Tardiphaga sp. vice352]|uniref:tyrosine-type recombinase/integrase n=1 Tax=Tardiphaga sp. vice352 TaxID=2592816 RepID=UPI0011630CBB|nr:site-specific integrase [Tardiphaga sp. vice352]QDM32186.1 site-specific integrase [Tardiphaga sp. vice352]